MANRYDIPNSATKYILFQRTRYLTFPTRILSSRVIRKVIPPSSYNRMVELEAKLRNTKVKAMYLSDMEREYLSIKEFLPNNCSSILDIGCGVAGIDLYLDQHYLNRGIDFFLLDKSKIEDSIYYMYKETGAFYNSLDIAKEILVDNGIDKNKVHLIETTEDHSIEIDKSVDLVLSLISWGFHYPVSVYLDNVYDLLNKGGTIIIDIRKNTDGLDIFTQTFSRYRIILESNKHFRVCATK